MPVSPNTARLKALLEDNTMDKITVKALTGSVEVSSSNLTVTGIQDHQNGSGAYVKGLNTVVKNVAWATGVHLSDAVIDSGAIYIPRNGVITRLSVIVSKNLAYGSSTLTIRAGTSAGGQQFIADSAGNLAASSTGLVRGKGISTDEVLSHALGANISASFVEDSLNFDAAGELHMQVTASAQDFTTGSVAFIADFVYMGDDV
jgi:hypothetical protein